MRPHSLSTITSRRESLMFLREPPQLQLLSHSLSPLPTHMAFIHAPCLYIDFLATFYPNILRTIHSHMSNCHTCLVHPSPYRHIALHLEISPLFALSLLLPLLLQLTRSCRLHHRRFVHEIQGRLSLVGHCLTYVFLCPDCICLHP